MWWLLIIPSILVREAVSVHSSSLTRDEPCENPEPSSLSESNLGFVSPKAKFFYFALWAKGPACAVALELSGIPWEGHNQGDWKNDLKPRTPWRELPVLEVPELGMIGHEVAILNYIASKVPAMTGASEKDFVISQQLMQEAEDIYQKLGKIQNTVFAKDKVPEDEVTAFWEDEPDMTRHNQQFVLSTYLSLLEDFYLECAASEGRFTSTGTTVGECKLWSTLHALKLIKHNVLVKYPGVAAFYARFSALPAAQDVLTTGGKMPAPFGQYFIA